MFCLSLTTQTFAQKKVHTIGDSTMDSYAGGGTDKMGWGGVLQQFFNGKDADGNTITVNNRGKSGSSSRTFYTDTRYWNTMTTGANAMKKGDILLIQFAHNDENNKGMDAVELQAYNAAHGLAAVTDLRGTIPTTTYKEYLRKYINEAKAMGVKPILVGAICRNYFNGTTIKKSGEHNLADGYSILTEDGVKENQKLNPDDNSMNYTYQMGEVAKEFDDVPFINFTQGTKELFEDLGATYCAANIFNVGDGTHTGIMGATLVARHFAKTLQAAINAETSATKKAVLEELAQYISLSSDIALTPGSMDFGSTYVGTPIVKSFSLAGFDLTPAKGNYTISASEGYEVSLDGESFASSLTLPYDGGSIFANVKVRGTTSADGVMDGKLTVSCGELTKEATLTMTGILNTSGTESKVVWSMADGNAVAAATGDIIAGEEVISGLVVGSPAYQVINDAKYRRYKTSEAWPDQMDEVADRYVQFSAEVPAGMSFRLDKIEMDIAAVATNNLRSRIYYATKADFSDAVQVKEFMSMASNTPEHVAVMPMKNLTAGDKIYIRVYPWMQGASSSSKYIALKDVTIHGYAEEIPQFTEETTTWDFSEFTTQVDLNESLNYSNPKYAYEYTKDNMTLLCVGTQTGLDSKGNKAEYLNNSYGFHCNGASSATTRHIQFTPQYDGKLTVSYRSNNSSATDRIVAIGTAVKTFNPIPDVLDEVVLAAGLTNGSNIQTISADLTAGTTYYAYFAYSGSSILKLQYDYKKPTSSTTPDDDFTETHAAYTWDFQKGNPASVTSVAFEKNSGSITSAQAQIITGNADMPKTVNLEVDATNGKFKYRSGDTPDIQMNAGTIVRVPVISTDDEVSVVCRSNAGNLRIDGEQTTAAKATFGDKSRGYIELTAQNGSVYIYSISVTQVMKPAAAEPELAAVKFNGETYGAEIFKAGTEEGKFNAAIRIASAAALPSADNAVEAVVEAGEAGTITYTSKQDNSVDVVIPVTMGELTYTYTLNVINKAAHTVTYYNADGASVIGTQSVDDEDKIAAYAYNAASVAIPEGEEFYGWFSSSDITSLEVPVTTVVTTDINLYARCGAPIAPVDGVYNITAGDAFMLMKTIKQAQSNTTINIPNGRYYFGETVLTALSANNVTLMGESMDGVIIENEPPVSQESINNTATILNKGTGNKFVNLTLKNSLDYYLKDNGRAVCLQDEGTKTICKNVRMLSYQDTYYSHKAGGLYYFEDCDIHGTVDFICGNGTAYFKNTRLYAEKRAKAGGGSDALTANASSDSEKGYVFEGCTIVSECPVISLGRSWNQAPQCVYLNTKCDFSKGEFTFTGNGIQRWTTAGMNVLPKKFGEYNTTLADASRAATDVVTPASNVVHFTYGSTSKDMETVLTAEDAASYTVESVLGAQFKKEIDDFIESIGTSITEHSADSLRPASDLMYSITGQRVSASHRGIVIVNGQKYVK